jgi:hypothetical protein
LVPNKLVEGFLSVERSVFDRDSLNRRAARGGHAAGAHHGGTG